MRGQASPCQLSPSSFCRSPLSVWPRLMKGTFFGGKSTRKSCRQAHSTGWDIQKLPPSSQSHFSCKVGPRCMKDSFVHCGIHSLTPDLKFFDPNVLIHQPCWHVFHGICSSSGGLATVCSRCFGDCSRAKSDFEIVSAGLFAHFVLVQSALLKLSWPQRLHLRTDFLMMGFVSQLPLSKDIQLCVLSKLMISICKHSKCS